MSKILIADDSHDGADTLALLLAFYGHQTAATYDGSEALALAASFLPEAVILDIDMPVIDGYSAAKLLHLLPAVQRPVLVALTAVGGTEALRRAADAGFDLHLIKPASARALSGWIDALLLERGRGNVRQAMRSSTNDSGYAAAWMRSGDADCQ